MGNLQKVVRQLQTTLMMQLKHVNDVPPKNLEAARLENSLVFQLDDKPIYGVESSASAAGTKSGFETHSIALGSRGGNKRRHVEVESSETISQASGDTVLLASSFQESTAVLAEALRTSRQNLVGPAVAPIPAPAPAGLELDQRITEVV